MGKKKHHEEHENHERWLVSYADFITLLFAFFVVMYSISRVDNKRLVQTSNSLKWALKFEGTGGVNAPPMFEGPPSEGGCAANTGTSPASSGKMKKMVETVRRKLEKRLQPFLHERPSNTVVVVSEGGRLVIRLAAGSFFDSSEAVLRPEALPIVDAIAGEVFGLGLPVRVEGHTDGQPPLSSGRFRSNWELSAARAATVVGYLEKGYHFPGALLTAAGRAGTRPISSDATPEGRETNRRIELVVEMDPPDKRLAAAP